MPCFFSLSLLNADSSEAFKLACMMWGGTASTSSWRAGGWPTSAPLGGWRRGCVDTSRATPLRLSEASGPTPPTFWRAQGASRWRLHGRRGYTKPTGRPTPREPPPRGRESLSTRVVHPTSRGLQASPPHHPAARQIPPPLPAAEAQAQCQDVGRGERRRPARAEKSRRLRVYRPSLPRRSGIFASTSLQV